MTIFTVGFNPAIDRVLECPDFHIGGHQTVRQMARLAAGKAANVSRALALLGHDSIASGFMGAEELEFFQTELMSVGPGRVLCRFIEVAGTTRENISILDPRRKLETHLRDKGFAVTDVDKRLLQEKLLHELRTGDMAVFAGSLCEGMVPGDLVWLMNQCGSAGAKLVVDSSGAPLYAALGRDEQMTAPRLFVVKPNLQELRGVMGNVADSTEEIQAAAEKLLNRVDHVLVSRGEAGAILVTARGSFSARVTQSRAAVRTVGCGDHLLAGFLSEIAVGRDLEPALRRAVAVATSRALSTDFAEFNAELAEQLMGEVEVVPLRAGV
jgi:1-phosphofructokinase